MTANPTKPAFNPWPYAVIAFFTVFVSCVVSFGVWAVRQRVDLVGADYYEREVRFQQQIDSEARTKALGEPVGIAYDATANRVVVALPAGAASRDVVGKIQLYRPSDSTLDRELALAPDAAGRQSVDTSELREGRWKIRVNWTASGSAYTAEQTVLVAGPATR
jgi:nitrogen fixation protein FixH